MAITPPVSIDDLKIKLKEVLSKKIVDIIADKSLPYAQIREMAIYVTDALPAVITNEDMSLFLEDVLEDFPFLNNEIIFMKNKIGQQKELQVMDKLRSYISNYDQNK